MSKRPHDSQAPASASEDLVVRLKAAGNDTVLLREIADAAIAALLTSQSAEATNDAKRLKKTLNRPSAPNETLVEILLFADRDTLDAMQLVCSFLLKFIRDREAKELPLRPISRVNIGKCSRPDIGAGWLPIVSVVRDSHTGQELVPGSVSKLVPYLRLAFCESVCVELRWTCYAVGRQHHEVAYGAYLGDQVLPNTVVNVLTVRLHGDGAVLALRAFETFKPTSKLVVESSDFYLRGSSFDEAFFLSAMECGARSIEFTSDVDITGIAISGIDNNFLEQLVKIASKLDGRQRIDYTFFVHQSAIDTDGFEKFRKDKRTWLVNDLQNGVMLEVVEAEESFEIHVFSSS